MRINKFLAEMGVASRRGADEMISAGRVQINGITANLGDSVEEKDQVSIDGKLLIRTEKKEEYYIMNKPKGVVCTVSDDRGRKTVMSFLPENCLIFGFPSGRVPRLILATHLFSET